MLATMAGWVPESCTSVLPSVLADYSYAEPEDIIWDANRSIDKHNLRSLLLLGWTCRMENVLLTGPSGTGQTWLACAIGHAMVRQGVSVRYVRVNPLLEEMRTGHLDGTISRMRKHLASAPSRSCASVVRASLELREVFVPTIAPSHQIEWLVEGRQVTRLWVVRSETAQPDLASSMRRFSQEAGGGFRKSID